MDAQLQLKTLMKYTKNISKENYILFNHIDINDNSTINMTIQLISVPLKAKEVVTAQTHECITRGIG